MRTAVISAKILNLIIEKSAIFSEINLLLFFNLFGDLICNTADIKKLKLIIVGRLFPIQEIF